MFERTAGKEWCKVKKEFVSNLEELSDKETEHKNIYILMKELLDSSKIKPSGGPKSG